MKQVPSCVSCSLLSETSVKPTSANPWRKKAPFCAKRCKVILKAEMRPSPKWCPLREEATHE